MGEPTAEIRWWGRDALPEAIAQWFEAGPAPAGGRGIRTDRYLLTDSEAVGIKYRGGADTLEIKSLVDRPVIDWGGADRMVAGIWIKHALALRLDAPAIAISKRRRLRLFDCAGGAPREIAISRDETLVDGQWPRQGCGVELAQVTRENDAWWSVCFEVFGTLDRVATNLANTLGHLAPLPEALLAARRASYPEWLADPE